MPPRRIDEAVFLRLLGDELRKARKRRGLIRRDLAPQLQPEVSTQTIATYELGTRAAPGTRFVEVCMLLGEKPADLLRRTWERMIDDPDTATGWDIDLAAAARLHDADLTPLAAWAAVRLAYNPLQPTTTRLSPAAITHLATLCGLDWRVLAARLPRPGGPAAGM
jgi:hypothetical protein